MRRTSSRDCGGKRNGVSHWNIQRLIFWEWWDMRQCLGVTKKIFWVIIQTRDHGKRSLALENTLQSQMFDVFYWLGRKEKAWFFSRDYCLFGLESLHILGSRIVTIKGNHSLYTYIQFQFLQRLWFQYAVVERKEIKAIERSNSVCVHACCCFTMPLWPHGLQPQGSACLWDSPGVNTHSSCQRLLLGFWSRWIETVILMSPH